MLKVIGAGLSRTGTYSLHQALSLLGLSSIHFDQERLNDILSGSVANPSFRRYDDVDAVVDLPAALFYRELMQAYPESKVVLTVRDLDAWWRSIKVHFTATAPIAEQDRILLRLLYKLGWRMRQRQFDDFRRHVRNLAYGSPTPTEFLYKKRFFEHNALVAASVPAERLLIMDIGAGDGWQKLCGFLNLPVPSVPFPHQHQTDYADPAPWARPAKANSVEAPATAASE